MDDTLTSAEIDRLRTLGWRIGGGGLIDGVVKVQGVRGSEKVLRTRVEWRAVLTSVSNFGGMGLQERHDALWTHLEETRAQLLQSQADLVQALAQLDAYRAEQEETRKTLVIVHQDRAVLRAEHEAMITRVHTFADQLLAWNHEDKARQVLTEILAGPVQTDQQYQTLLAYRAGNDRKARTLAALAAAFAEGRLEKDYVEIVSR